MSGNGNGNDTYSPDVHALIAPYVLDAVDDLERTAFERHLAVCEACQFEVAELRSAAVRLGDDVAVGPPPGMRDRVLAATRQTRQVAPGPRPVSLPTDARAARTWKRRAFLAVAAAVVAFGAAAATFTVMGNRLDEERQETAAVAEVLAAPDAQVSTEDIEGGGRASVVFSESEGQAVVVLADLPDIPDEQAYQLWYVGDEIRSAGVLGSSVDTTPVLLGDVGGAEAIALSVEPSGGSDQPTTDPITAVPLQ
jgi:anti-sigma-K factor RskA